MFPAQRSCLLSIFRIIATLAVIGLSFETAAETKSGSPRPNIILILSDDMGFSDLGCYGGEIQTPNLDSLAANGLRFTQFYNTARCCPTRASLLTGLHPHQAGMGHMTVDHGVEGYQGDLNNRCVTIAEVMRTAGYRTYAIGKWHVARNAAPNGPRHNWPLQRGFEKYYGTIWGAASYYDPGICRGNDWYASQNDPDYKPAQYYFTNALSDNAVTFLQQHEKESPDKPFFMYVAYTAAHWPMHALEKDIARYKGRFDAGYDKLRQERAERLRKMGMMDPRWEVSATARKWEDVKHRDWELRCMEVYAAMIDCMDQGIGRIMAELKRQGSLDNTLILFLQDNGGCAEEIGRQEGKGRKQASPLRALRPDELPVGGGHPTQTRDGLPMRSGPQAMPGVPDTYIAYGEGWANLSNTPFREYKHWVHEGGIATPLIVHWPAGIPKSRANSLVSEPGQLVDIMATCVDVGQATYPRQRNGVPVTPMQGVSLRPTFRAKPLDRPRPLLWEHEGNRAVRDGKWKLVAKEDKPWELYDMQADRTELHNLATGKPQLVKKLAAKWDAWAARSNVLPLGSWRNEPGRREGGRLRVRQGETLPPEKSPATDDRALTITVEIVRRDGDGMLLAQGGKLHGYALYVQGGKLCFDVRRDGILKTLAAGTALGNVATTVTAVLDRKGAAGLLVGGKHVAARPDLGTLVRTPGDGLSAGLDSGDPVGAYEGEFAFAGKLGLIEIATDAKAKK